MKKDIHPIYYPNAIITCSCGNSFTVGSTKPSYEVEICSACHPFYTGKGKLIDTAGRVERFKKHLAKKHADGGKKKVRIRKPRVENLITPSPAVPTAQPKLTTKPRPTKVISKREHK